MNSIDFQSVRERMASCRQSEQQTVLEHGEAVHQKFRDLIEGRTEGWRVPEWLSQNEEFLKSLLPSDEVLRLYHTYHDCGKPFCRTVDEHHRQHFPDHARVSAAIWAAIGGDAEVRTLIACDMDMHLLKPAEVESYKNLDIVGTLLITALAELHSNAGMFGGIESTSFKIKYKNLTKLGNKFLQILKETS